MSGDAPPQGLSAEMPADAAFRCLGRLCEERARTRDGQGEGDQGLVWRHGQQTAIQLAQWARRLPPSLQGRIQAAHLASGLSVLCGEREGDTQDRQVHRIVLTLYLSLLQQSGVRPAEDLYVAAALWAFLQRMALLSAVSIDEGRMTASRVQRLRSAAMRMRENLVTDMAEIVIAGAAQVLTAATAPAMGSAPAEPPPGEAPPFEEPEA